MLLTVVQFIHGLPRTPVTELPNYPRYTESAKSHRSFTPKAPSPFTSAVEYNDATAAATQRGPNYIQNPYLYQNVIPIKQKVQQVGRPGKTGPQQFANPEEPLTEVKFNSKKIVL